MFKYRVDIMANNFNDKCFADIVLCAAGSSDGRERVLTYLQNYTASHLKTP
jgi:fructoselysine-6-P-deglycase FrlB-like protein